MKRNLLLVFVFMLALMTSGCEKECSLEFQVEVCGHSGDSFVPIYHISLKRGDQKATLIRPYGTEKVSGFIAERKVKVDDSDMHYILIFEMDVNQEDEGGYDLLIEPDSGWIVTDHPDSVALVSVWNSPPQEVVPITMVKDGYQITDGVCEPIATP